MRSEHTNQLRKFLDVQRAVQDIHPFLEKVFPIAIVEGDRFLIYDVKETGTEYVLVKEAATPIPIPEGVRAAFPLESYDHRMACIVTEDVFDELDGYVTILHEFIHCQQFETCEQKLKQELGIARQAQQANDHMWEINHPFPYTAPAFAQTYHSFLTTHEMHALGAIRRQLKTILPVEDYEYMVWQEWKEGFARFVENQIRHRLGLQENHGGQEQPFNRVVFYAGGSHYITVLAGQEPGLAIDIESLFARMYSGR